MTGRRFAGAATIGLLLGGAAIPLAADAPVEDALAITASSAPYFRVFLKDGTSLVSYGEMARVDDRIVFSMPTSASADHPELQLVNIPLRRVDWTRTENYSESARAARYFSTRAEYDYARMTSEIETALNEVAFTTDFATRLAIVERARKTLADWPAAHYGYKQTDVRQMLGLMDEAILDLRAATGARQFEISLVAPAILTMKQLDPLLPPPTAQQAIQQTLAVAAIAESPAERLSLLSAARASIERDRSELPADWANSVSTSTTTAIAREVETDRAYRSLSDRMLNLATSRAGLADVKGISALVSEIHARDEAIGKTRPDTVLALLAAVGEQLDAARRLKLARERWALRLPEMRAYYTSVQTPLQRLFRLRESLEDIRSLAGSSPDALNTILSTVVQVQRATTVLVPPEELREVHSLLLSATELAENAAKIRRQAALSGDMARAWDASSAAAGALMLYGRAESALQEALRIPQLPR